MIIGNINGALLVILAYVYLIDTKKSHKAKTKHESKPEINDVIKNITRVNTALQELIRNYEQLNKLSKKQSLETDYSTDLDEIDEDYKEKRRKKRIAMGKGTSKKDFPGTYMQDVLSQESSVSHTENSNEKLKKIINEPIDTAQKNTTPKTGKIKVKLKIKKQKTYKGASKRSHTHEKKSTIEQTFLTTKSNDSSKAIVGKKKVKKRKHEKLATTHSTPRSRKNNHTVSSTFNFQPLIVSKDVKKKKTVERFTTTKRFPEGDVWSDPLLVSKRVNLGAAEQFIFRNRPQPKKTLVIVDRDTKKKTKYLAFSSSVEDERDIVKEEFKAFVLRTAYDHACYKVVIRKCYKACKAVLRRSCKKHKCTAEFKDSYTHSARTQCIQQFKVQNGFISTPRAPATKPYKTVPGQSVTVTASRTTTTTQPTTAVSTTSTDTATTASNPLRHYSKPDKEFVDVTREGFDFESCFPFMAHEINSNVSKIDGKVKHPMNVLRSRFERACERASIEKCTPACQITGTVTCQTFPCKATLLKSLQSHCPKRCEAIYKGKKKHKKKKKTRSNSSDSSGSSSDSSGSSSDSSGSSDSSDSSGSSESSDGNDGSDGSDTKKSDKDIKKSDKDIPSKDP